MKVVSIVVPVFNEEKFIKKAIFAIINAQTPGYRKEIIIVDDGSTDNTLDEIMGFLHDSKKISGSTIIKLIKQNHNKGKGAALKEGFLSSSGDIVIVQDADLEYSPADYPLLLEPIMTQGADVVYGSRFISNRPHRVLYFWHYKLNVFLTNFSNMLTNLNLTDMETGVKVFKGELIRGLAKRLVSQRFGFEPEITARIAKIKGVKVYEVGISYSGRTYEEGKKIGWQDGIKALGAIVWFNLFN